MANPALLDYFREQGLLSDTEARMFEKPSAPELTLGRTNLNSAFDLDPERERRVHNLNREGVPLVDDNSGTLESRERDRERARAMQSVHRYDSFTQWLAQYPNNASVISDDLRSALKIAQVREPEPGLLEQVETFLSGLGSEASIGLELGALEQQIGLMYAMRMQNRLNESDQRLLLQMEARESLLRGNPKAKRTVPQEFARGTGITFGQLADRSVQALPRTLVGGITAGTAAAAYSAAAGPAAPAAGAISVPAATVTGMSIGYTAESLRLSSLTMAGLAYREITRLEDINGNPIDDDIARGWAWFVGSLGGALEAAGMGAVLKASGAGAFLQSLTNSEARRIFSQPTVRAALKNFGKNWGLATAGEITTEVAQTVVEQLAIEAAKYQDDGTFVHKTPEELLAELPRVVEQTLYQSLIPSSLGPTTRAVYEVGNVAKAQQRAEAVQSMAEAVRESKLLDKAPDKLQGLIQHTVEDTGQEFVYIDGETLRSYFEVEHNLSLEQVASQLPSVANQIDDIESGGEVKIPYAEFQTRLAPSPHLDGLLPHIRFSPTDLSTYEIEQEAAAQAAEADFAAQATEAVEADPDVVSTPQSVRVRDEVYSQLVEAGVSREEAEAAALVFETFDASISSQVEAPEIQSSPSDAALEQTQVQSEYVNEAGEPVTVNQNAKQALSDAEQAEQAVSNLMDCITR